MDYDINKYKTIRWTNWQLLHWIINPGLAINELVFGQRLPKVMLVEKLSHKVLAETSLVPCPNCGILHDEKLWWHQNAYKNWFGLYCPNCHKAIPCVRNIFSFVALILTSVFWIWTVKKRKQQWIERQPQRFETTLTDKETDIEALSLKIGASFGGFMYVISAFINPLLMGEEISLLIVLVSIPVWIIGGVCFNYMLINLNQLSKKSRLSRRTSNL